MMMLNVGAVVVISFGNLELEYLPAHEQLIQLKN